MKHDYPSISVSQFFEDMVNEGNVTPEASPMTASDPSMPDLREVSEVDVNSFFGKPSAPKSRVVTEAKAPSKDLKQEMLDLMVEFKQVVQKANKLFTEMTAGTTTTGMTGANFGGSPKKPKRNPLFAPENPLDDLNGKNRLGKQLPPRLPVKKKLSRKKR